MKKTQKGFVIAFIKISKDKFIEVCNSEGELLKTTRAQRDVILHYANNKSKLVEEIKRAFNNDKIIDSSVVISIEK